MKDRAGRKSLAVPKDYRNRETNALWVAISVGLVVCLCVGALIYFFGLRHG